MIQLTKTVLGGIVARLQSGKTTLGKESKALGISRNGPLREALRQHVGSKEAYLALIAKAWEKRPRTKGTGTKKASRAKTPKKKLLPDDDSKDSNNDDEDSGEPQDVVEAMSGGQEEERREELVQNGVAGVDVDVDQVMSLV